MMRRRLHDRPERMAAGIEDLAVQHAVDEIVTARVDLDARDREAFDLVHVETFVQPVDQQRLE
jgi:hypothetical protein